MAVKLESNVPVTSNRGRKLKYQFDTMKVGQSFAVPYTPKSFNSIKTSAYGYGNRHKKSFRASSPVERGKRVTRIWRTK